MRKADNLNTFMCQLSRNSGKLVHLVGFITKRFEVNFFISSSEDGNVTTDSNSLHRNIYIYFSLA